MERYYQNNNKSLDMNILEAFESHYVPSFFRMKVGTYEDLVDMQALPYGAFSLFFHEYIHFLQDITTIYGLMNLHTITYYIHEVASRVNKDPNQEFEVPQQLHAKPGDYGFENFELRFMYMGSPINPKYASITITDLQKVPYPINGQYKTDRIQISFTDDKTGEADTFFFGGNHVCEGMAYLCESYIYKPLFESNGHKYSEADDYPYHVCRKLAQRIYPEIAQYEVLLVAVCDLALMTYHPGLSYVRLLEKLQSDDFINRPFENLYEAIIVLYEEGNAFLKGMHEDFSFLQNYVKEAVKKNFKCDEFEGNNRWLDLVFEKANLLRTQIPQFITDIILFSPGKDVRENKPFIWTFGLLGSPLMINDDAQGAFCLPVGMNPKDTTFMPGLFWAIQRVAQVFANEKALPCALKEHCRQSVERMGSDISIDDRCDTAPWSRCNDNRLCPFATIWRHWALTGHIPVVRKTTE